MSNLLIYITVVISSFIVFAIGVGFGQHSQQNTIVEECKRDGVYLDRRLLIQCRVSEPMEQRGSTS